MAHKERKTKLKDGSYSYRLVYPMGYDSNGKKNPPITKTIRVSGDRGPDKADKELDLFVAEIEQGLYIAPEKMRFAAFVEEWERIHAKENLRSNTVENYKVQLRNHILPIIGDRQLNQIKTIELDNLISGFKKKMTKKALYLQIAGFAYITS